MYSIVFYAANGKETTATASSYSRAMDRASQIAIAQSRPPFPILIKLEGQIIQTIHG
jgi:hypothetical protein